METGSWADLHSKVSKYFDEGNYTLAIEFAQKAIVKAINIYGEIDNHTAVSFSDLGLLYQSKGLFEEAEKSFLEALEIYRKFFGYDNIPAVHPDLALCLNNLGTFYQMYGRFTEAEKLFKQSVSMYRKLYPIEQYPHGQSELATSINNLGVLYNLLGRYENAEKLLIESLDMRKKLYPLAKYSNGHTDIANSLNNLGIFYKDLRKITIAEKFLTEALTMFRNLYPQEKYKIGHTNLATSLNNLGDLYQIQSRYDEAEKLLTEVLKIYGRLFPLEEYPHGHFNLASILNSLGDLYQVQGRYEEADKSYKKALNIYTDIYFYNSSFLNEKEKEQFWSTVNYHFVSFYSFIEKRVKKNEEITITAYNNLLFTKALLLSSTKKMKSSILNSKDSTAISLFNQWISKKEQINHFSSLTINELKDKRINLDSLEKQANNIEKELSSRSAEFAKGTEKKLFTWTDVQNSLKQDEAAIEMVRYKYHDGKRWTDTIHYAAYLIKKDSKYPELVVFENGNSIEDKFYSNYSAIFMPDDQKRYGNGRNRMFYDSLWAPIEAILGGVKKVYISVDGVFNKMNFDVFYNGDTKRFLFQDMDIVYLTSTRDLTDSDQKKRNSPNEMIALYGKPKYNLTNDEQNQIVTLNNKKADDFVLKGSLIEELRAGNLNDLPGSEIVVRKIDSIARSRNIKTSMNLEAEANEASIKGLNNPKVLHISTHGFFLSQEEVVRGYQSGLMREKALGFEVNKAYTNPLLRSGVLLAGASNVIQGTTIEGSENGILTAAEAMNLNLDNTELVVLSACETGLGDIKNGEGVYGLQRAFIQAGAKNLLMSLCKVPDKETQELMVKFYEKWLSGTPIRQAYKDARNEIFIKYPEPIYWGSFVFFGE